MSLRSNYKAQIVLLLIFGFVVTAGIGLVLQGWSP